MGLGRRFRDFRDWCPQPPDRLPTRLKQYSLPIAAVLTATLILSVSFFVFSSSIMSNPYVPIEPLVNVPASTTPTLLWNYSVGGYSSPAVDDGAVYVNGFDLNAINGAQLWNSTDGGTISPAVIVNGVIYTGSNYGARSGTSYVYALNAKTGAQLWSYTNGYSSLGSTSIESSPDVVGGVVYIGALEGGFFALNGKTGVPLWDYGGYDFGVVSSAAVVDGRVYFGSLNGNVYALNSANGGQIWNYTTTGGVRRRLQYWTV